ncbi:hypothetical protein [Neorhizobium sp. DT-125]|uniref:hypothetical protein n=1 Tax=Neorhizobium sp. DT-125 TaxID=3396163 RepID=UPI003F1DD549
MTKITSAFAAALIATASFASVALAEGDYYEGVQKGAPAASASVDTVRTASVGKDRAPVVRRHDSNSQIPNAEEVIGRGDYYEGAVRPN